MGKHNSYARRHVKKCPCPRCSSRFWKVASKRRPLTHKHIVRNDRGVLLEFCLTFTGLRLVLNGIRDTEKHMHRSGDGICSENEIHVRFFAYNPQDFPFLLSKHRHTDTTTVTLNTIQTPLNIYTTTTNTSEHTHTPLNTATPHYSSSSSHLHTQPQTHQQQKPTSCITHTRHRQTKHTNTKQHLQTTVIICHKLHHLIVFSTQINHAQEHEDETLKVRQAEV